MQMHYYKTMDKIIAINWTKKYIMLILRSLKGKFVKTTMSEIIFNVAAKLNSPTGQSSIHMGPFYTVGCWVSKQAKIFLLLWN